MFTKQLNLVMENSEIQLRENVQFIIEWMNKYRPQIAGMGALIMMLKNILKGEDIKNFATLVKQAEDSNVFDNIEKKEFKTNEELKDYFNKI